MKYEQKYHEAKAKVSGDYEEDEPFSTFENPEFIENQEKLKASG
jgi:hypothetical protein